MEWFNSVDATYQSQLRELNDANFARFDAKLEQRVAGIEAKIDGLEARLDSRIDGLEARFDARLETRTGSLEAKMDQRFAEHRESLTTQLAAFESRITRWMFTMWTGTMIALAGVLIAVLRST